MNWQTIDTAPKDGTSFWGLVGEDAISMFWHGGFGAFVSEFGRIQLAPGLTWEDGSKFRDHSPVVHNPRFWMAKVTPPQPVSPPENLSDAEDRP